MLKDYLSKNNISVYSLAKRSGVSYSMLNDLSNGKTCIENIRLGYAISVAEALEINLSELISICKNELYCESEKYRAGCRITAKNKSYYADFTYKGSPVQIRLCKVNEQNTEYIRTIASWQVDHYISNRRMEEFR